MTTKTRTAALTLNEADAARAALRGGPGDGAAGRPRGGRLVRAMLQFPLFYKILVANAVVMGVVVGAALMVTHANLTTDGPKLLVVLGCGLLLSVASNAVILRVALSPLKRLEDTAGRVQAGDLTARVEPSELADRQLERLRVTFNGVLESGAQYRKRLRETAARALNAQEEERRRIAQELHDGTAQTLAALRVRLRVARSLEEGDARTELLERLGAELGEATEEVRRIAQGLRPPALDMLGLAPAIESCARGFADTAGLALDTRLEPVEGLLTPDAELALYRIVQEALSNVARHAGAGTVTVRLVTGAGAVMATVADDGRGFSVESELSSGGLGLFGMQERAGYVGGTVAIESEPGGGTQVRATIPILETARYA